MANSCADIILIASVPPRAQTAQRPSRLPYAPMVVTKNAKDSEASPGAACGKVYFTQDEVLAAKEDAILVTVMTTQEDVRRQGHEGLPRHPDHDRHEGFARRHHGDRMGRPRRRRRLRNRDRQSRICGVVSFPDSGMMYGGRLRRRQDTCRRVCLAWATAWR